MCMVPLRITLNNRTDFFIYQIQGEFEEGMERVTKAEEREVNQILERKLQEVHVAQEVERVKQQAIKESDAQFVQTPQFFFLYFTDQLSG